MNTELIICPEYQASVFETQLADKGCEIISKRPDWFDNFAHEVAGDAVYNEEWQEELKENGIEDLLCPPKAQKLSFAFMGGAWAVFESSGRWVQTTNGNYWERAKDYKDPETGDCREYATIYLFEHGVHQEKWWHILTERQREEIISFAESKQKEYREFMRINGREYIFSE